LFHLQLLWLIVDAAAGVETSGDVDEVKVAHLEAEEEEVGLMVVTEAGVASAAIVEEASAVTVAEVIVEEAFAVIEEAASVETEAVDFAVDAAAADLNPPGSLGKSSHPHHLFCFN
jgi:hypothetical protein